MSNDPNNPNNPNDPNNPQPQPTDQGQNVADAVDAGLEVVDAIQDYNELSDMADDLDAAAEAADGLSEASDAADGIGGLLEEACFGGDTRVATPRGQRKIKDIAAGETILSYDARTQTLVERSVTRALAHGLRKVVHLKCVGDESALVVTPSHRVLSEGTWMQVRDLKPGSSVQREKGSARVESITEVSEQVPVFNLHTAGEHTFVAGGLVVHNFVHFVGLRTLAHRLFVDPLRGGADALVTGTRQAVPTK